MSVEELFPREVAAMAQGVVRMERQRNPGSAARPGRRS